MPFKVLYINLFPEIGGAETSLIYLLQKLDRKKFNPTVIVPKLGLFSNRLEKIGVKIEVLELPGFFIRTLFIPGINLFALLKLIRLCKILKPDLIHLTHITQAFYGGVASKLFKIPCVATSWMNSDSVYFYQNMFSNIFCSRILPVTNTIKNRLISKGYIDESKITVLTPGIDTNYFKPSNRNNITRKFYKIPKSNLVITIASRFDPVKDHISFLKAINIVYKYFKNFTVLIAQDRVINLEKTNTSATKVYKQISTYLSNHPYLKSKIKFIGYYEDMLPIYNSTDILVSSSLYESLGMIHMEASSCGTPIVSTNFDGQHHVVVDNKTGFLVPIKKPRILADKILGLLNNKSLRERFGKEARKFTVKNHNINTYVINVQNVYVKEIMKMKA